MKLILTLPFASIAALSLLAMSTASMAQNQPLRCEVRSFCHDTGMPSAEDETSHFISVFLIERGTEAPQMTQTMTYDYGTSVPDVQWSADCESHESQMRQFMHLADRIECVPVATDGSYSITWP